MLSAMLDFFTIAVSFPALPYTVAVAVSTTFWVVSLVAGIDFGADGADGALDGALDGAGDGVGEAVEVGADRFHVQKRVTRTDDGSGPGSVTVWLKPALAKP